MRWETGRATGAPGKSDDNEEEEEMVQEYEDCNWVRFRIFIIDLGYY